MHRDDIHFQALRYLDPVLAAYVREPVTLRYDPRDITAIRVFHHNHYLCAAISLRSTAFSMFVHSTVARPYPTVCCRQYESNQNNR
ncbi:Mu transposase C-terminal domain-containing protein [Rhodococcus rhodochrous]|uniref:Mu transposase C-terminal domain-containing protein n=1 Tax=Rhodococcus rhodochrous TaxID=1829 RepID=UPI0024BB7276|nr:Mu transposase C-terminal domain-containing protein [Rhodococcus rhodochrous]MDJ0401704.1 Mu transposase C-terminal domain-containing protein [Rhodococcus rhodochrous]